MLTGLYQGAAAMSGLEKWQDAISDNIANSSVAGFRGVGVAMHSQHLPEGVAEGDFDSALGSELVKADLKVNYDPGMRLASDEPLDCSIDGDGFFTTRDSEGVTHYTRDGRFHTNTDGQLVTANGDQVMNGGAAIQGSAGLGDMRIDTYGKVYQGNQQVGQISVVDIKNKDSLVNVGNGFVAGTGDPGVSDVANPKLINGFYETGNVSVMREMVNMINVSRAYEANSKTIGNADTTLGKAIQAFGV